MENGLLGKHLLVGLTYLDEDDEVRERVQLHGIISAASDNTIHFIRSDNEEVFSIPNGEDAISVADAGAYQLNDSDEIVLNPDYVSTWTIRPSPPEDAEG